MAGALYYHVSKTQIGIGETLLVWNPEPKLVRFLLQTIQKGVDHVETALRTDTLVSESRGEAMSPAFKVAFQEALIELERRENFPDRPSRIGSPQMFRTIEAARTFCREYGRVPGFVYSCKITTGEPFDTFMDWTSGGSAGTKTVADIVNGKREYAAKYWRPDAPERPIYPETLVKGTAVIVGLAESVLLAGAR